MQVDWCGWRLIRSGALILLAAALTVPRSSLLRAQDTKQANALNAQVGQLYQAGKYAEAIPLAQRALAIDEKALGPDHPNVGRDLNNLARLYDSQVHYGDAEPLYKRALAIAEKAFGPDHPNVGTALNNLAGLYDSQGRYGEAEPLYKRALAIQEKAFGPDHANVGSALNDLAGLYWAQGRYSEAEPLLKRALAIDEKALGPDHADVGNALNNLAELYEDQGRYSEAELLLKRALAIQEKAFGPDDPTVGTYLNNLAALYSSQGRYGEAEPRYKRALAITEKNLGPDHPDVGRVLGNLAELYRIQGRYGEAEPLSKRALAITEKALGAEHPDVGIRLNNLAELYRAQGRYSDAEPLSKRALAIDEKALGPDHHDVGRDRNNLALLYQAQGRYGDAESLFRRALSIDEKALGPDHPNVGTHLNNLAALYYSQNRYGDAEPLYKRALAIAEKTLGPDHPDVGRDLNNLATLHFVQGDWSGAAELWRRSTGIIERRAQRGTLNVTGRGKSEASRSDYQFFGLVKSVHRLATEAGPSQGQAAEMFEAAQWAQSSEAASSLAQMAARGAKGDPKLAALVRERQDLVTEWQKRDGVHDAAVSQPPDKRDRAAETANTDRLAAIDTRVAEIDERLKSDFPDYAALASPAPLSVADVQPQLRPDEALVLFLDTPIPEETFVWVVTKSEMRWARSELGSSGLKREVAALRCGLDGAAWKTKGQTTCADLLKLQADQASSPASGLPFDAVRAHALYKALLGEVEDLIAGKQLLIVPSGSLTQLPFQVLVTKPPKGSDYKSVAWLARDHALTILPAVSSLAALRRVSRPSTAPLPMIGFGDPLLDGNQKHPIFGDYFKKQAALARANQSCPKQTFGERVAALFGRDPIEPLAARGGLADVNLIRFQAPLPETAQELCDVAADLKADRNEMRLGARATEHELKALSASGELAKYRIVHFATHGALAGQLRGSAEPGLILTPPDTATEDDDGYLSASEIAGLKLDADWVILSACNTAGGEAGGDALSGLARAFFYAGARALLVSHWSVNSDATVKLITSAAGEITRDKTVGRGEALRRAMLAMIDTGKPEQAHPSYWAPFVVVGEGAATR